MWCARRPVQVVFTLALLAAASPSCKSQEVRSAREPWSEQMLEVGGLERRWLLVRPETEAKVLPVLVFLHGLDEETISKQTADQYTFLAQQARSLGFIAAYPRGLRGALPAQAGSLGWQPVGEDANRRFLLRLIEVLVSKHGADRARIVLGGFSNGAFFVAKELLCERDTPFSAFFVSAGGNAAAECTPHRRVPVYVEIGLNDTYQLAGARAFTAKLEQFGWLPGRDILVVEHPGGHAFYGQRFDDIWRFLAGGAL